MQEKILKLDLEVRSQRAEVESLQHSLKAQASLAESHPGKLLRVGRVKFDRFSGPVDNDGDGNYDIIRLYVLTLDARGRFMPAVGRAVVQVVAIEPEREPVVLSQQQYDPQEFDQTYRNGLTGTHYTLEVPLPWPVPDEIKDATVKLTFIDASTDATFSYEQPVRLRGSAVPASP